MAREGGSYIIEKKGGEPKLVHRTKPAELNNPPKAVEPAKKSEVNTDENA